jgi:hypothetical protein
VKSKAAPVGGLFNFHRAGAPRKGDGFLTPTPSCYPSIDGQHDSGQCTFSRFAQARLGSSVNQIDRPYPSAPINFLDDGIFYAAILHKKKLQQKIAV